MPTTDPRLLDILHRYGFTEHSENFYRREPDGPQAEPYLCIVDTERPRKLLLYQPSRRVGLADIMTPAALEQILQQEGLSETADTPEPV